jgi:hypothetical protein
MNRAFLTGNRASFGAATFGPAAYVPQRLLRGIANAFIVGCAAISSPGMLPQTSGHDEEHRSINQAKHAKP